MPVGISQYQEGISVWKQIFDDLQRRIDAGEWSLGERIASEALLAEAYGVNRHTIRRALAELANIGLVDIRHGSGIFVHRPGLEYPLIPRPRFSEWVKKYKKPGRQKILEARTASLTELPEYPQIKDCGVFPDPSHIVLLRTVGYMGEDPVFLARHIFFAPDNDLFVNSIRSGLGISESLKVCGIYDYRRLRSTIAGIGARAEESRLLNVRRGECLFVSENVNVDLEGRGIEFSLVSYPASRVRMVYEPDVNPQTIPDF